MQVTVPRYKMSSSNGGQTKNLITFNMVCYGLSQNTQNHQLISYSDAILGKSYNEICGNLAVKMIYEPYSVYVNDKMVWKDGKMDMPYTPVRSWLVLNQMVLDSEMIQTQTKNKVGIFQSNSNNSSGGTLLVQPCNYVLLTFLLKIFLLGSWEL